VVFPRALRFPLPIETDRHDITEILLKVALNTIHQTEPKPMSDKNNLKVSSNQKRETREMSKFCIGPHIYLFDQLTNRLDF